VSPLYTYSQFFYCQIEPYISSKKVFYFQLATGGFNSAVYKKLIAPFKNDLPASILEGFRSVCAGHKYAFLGPNLLKTKYSSSIPCQLVPLPETFYEVRMASAISKNSTYKSLINWRWDNKINSITYMTDSSRLWVPHNSPNTKVYICLLLDIRAITTGM